VLANRFLKIIRETGKGDRDIQPEIVTMLKVAGYIK